MILDGSYKGLPPPEPPEIGIAGSPDSQFLTSLKIIKGTTRP